MCDFCFGNSKAYCVLKGIEYEYFQSVDKKFKDYAKKQGGVEYQVPALIDGVHLKRCGYFNIFPQHLTIAAHVKSDNYKKVSKEGKIELNDVEIEDKYFTPAACLHIYPTLEGEKAIEKIITTKARVYRYENKEYDGLIRLWDFTVREIVFVGSPEFVREKMALAKEETLNYSKEIGLSSTLKSANDHFYPTTKNKVREKIQRANSLKEELVVPIQEQEVAIASFNYHDAHFSGEYNFDNDGKIVTGCIGYGLERWVAALRAD